MRYGSRESCTVARASFLTMATGENVTATKLWGPTLYYKVSSTKPIDSGHDLTSSSALCAAMGEQVCYNHLDPRTFEACTARSIREYHIPTSGSILHHVLLTVWPH